MLLRRNIELSVFLIKGTRQEEKPNRNILIGYSNKIKKKKKNNRID
jgi:hypothetical protein